MKKIIQLVQNINGIDEKVYPMTTVDAIIGLDGPIDPSNPSLEGYATEQWTEERIDELGQYIYQDIDSLSSDIKKLKSETILKFSGVLYNESEANGKAVGDIYYVKSKDYFIEVIEGGTKIADNSYHKSFNDGMSFKGNEDRLYHLGGDLYRLTNNNMVKYALVSELITGEGGDIDLSGYLTKIEAEQSYQPKGNYTNSNEFAILKSQVNTAAELNATQSNQITALQNNKQNKLTSGKGISIIGDTISCTLDTSLYKIVETLPQIGEENKIYLIASNVPGEQSVYTEYAYVNGTWETIGEYTATIDLTEYVKKEELPTKVSQLENDSKYITNNEFNSFKGSGLISSTIKELEDAVFEESNKLANITNELHDYYVLTLESETGSISQEIFNKLNAAKIIILNYRNTLFYLRGKSLTSNSGLLHFVGTDNDLTMSIFVTITTSKNYTITEQISDYKETFIWEWDGETSGSISLSDYQLMIDFKQIIIKKGYTYYIPEAINKVGAENNITNIICSHISHHNSDTNIIRRWLFNGNTFTYQESFFKIPTNTSQLNNDSGFITELPNNLVTTDQLKEKQDTLTVGEGISIKNNVISCTLDTTLYKVVVDLPSKGEANKIYLVESNAVGEQNIYIEYAYINGTWEILGEYRASVNLEPYALKTEIPKKLSQLENDANYATANEVATAIAQAITTTLNKEV